MARKSRRTQRLRVVNPDCAGIDIGKDRHFVAVEAERTEEPVRSFGAFTRDLEEMAAWLASCGVTKVAMESTSVYWIPVYETLERAGFEVMLVPPRMTKQIGGRKSDVLDCQWIWQLMSYGLLRGAFRPGDEVCPLRSYARQMRRLTGDRSRCVLHMQKALTEMNVKLDSVIANITGLTGQRILRAIIDGERDPERLATLRHRGIKADADTIAASLQGTWREEHLFALEQAMQRYDFLTQQIDDCEARVMAEIERLTPPDDLPDGGAPDPAPGTTSETASSRSANAASNYTGKEGIQALALRGMMGVDLTAIPTIGPGTALVIASEIGPDFSAFPSAQHFCSWLALAPGTRISGGKNLPGKSPKAVNPVGQGRRDGDAGGRPGLRDRGRDLHGGRQGAGEHRGGDRAGSAGAERRGCARRRGCGCGAGLRGDAQPGGERDGDGGLRDIGRHRDGGRGLHGNERHAHLRGGRDGEDGGRDGARRRP